MMNYFWKTFVLIFLFSIISCSTSKKMGLKCHSIENLSFKQTSTSYLEINGDIIVENPKMISGGEINSKGLTLYFDSIKVQQIQVVNTKIVAEEKIRISLVNTLINYNEIYDKNYKDKVFGFLILTNDIQNSKVINVRIEGELICTSNGNKSQLKIEHNEKIQLK